MTGNTDIFKYRTERILSAPIMINLEITSGCNIKCRHCYNFWRDDSRGAADRISREKMDRLIEMIRRDNVFHVVLTGGEPFLHFDVLEDALEKLHASGISTSINSNLMLATPDKIQRLKNAGADHVLTSLNSHDPKTNDYMVNRNGAFPKIIRGIETTIEQGLRVSVNMIICETNKDHIFETAKLCSEIGVQKLFATRLVPSINVRRPTETDLRLDRESALSAVDDLLKANETFGIQTGSLISYPLCLLGDLEKYEEFVGRGCPAQRGNRMVINADGETHACTHEARSYGNVFDIGIRKAFEKMREWHDGSYLYHGCGDCEYIDVCGSGCRSAAYSYFGKMNERDPLFTGPKGITHPYRIDIPADVLEWIDRGEEFETPQTIRFRGEKDFYTINIQWANAFSIDRDIAEFLIQRRSEGKTVSIRSMTGKNPMNELIKLISKEALVPANPLLRKSLKDRVKKGCSVNPYDLPDILL